jgi:hypothetical protein
MTFGETVRSNDLYRELVVRLGTMAPIVAPTLLASMMRLGAAPRSFTAEHLRALAPELEAAILRHAAPAAAVCLISLHEFF